MNRSEQLAFCRKCTKRQMDLKEGLICSLSGARASFESECVEFTLDDTVKEIVPQQGTPYQNLVNRLPNEVFEKLRFEQNLPMALITGIAVGIFGAILWSMITLATEHQIGYMAIAIGFGVGYTVRCFGKGIDQVFGIIGAVISLLSCVLGNVLSIIGFIANSQGLGYWEAWTHFNFNYLPELMFQTFNVMDLLFYGLAIYEGYRFSFRKFAAQDLELYSVHESK